MANRSIISLLFLLMAFGGYTQNVQTIRGYVIDKNSQVGLPGVNIIVDSVNSGFGTATDADGYYVIDGVPIGRHAVQFSFIGYNDVVLSNISLISGKQAVVDVSMEEQVTQMDEVVVAAVKKSESQNKMATVSVRTFSVEESERFAGSLGDVSRMATNFAGVQAANDAVNEIVIRGNAPGGLLWRLDGINIPNPNHFGNAEATAGPVSMLNNNVLSNSDFYTGAFPAEYGNATSGVFDLRMRNGNSEKHEFLGQVGFGGFEAGAEGPLSFGKRASYIANYRYSTLAAMAAMGMPMPTGTAIPYYQDFTAKLNIPTENAGSFSIIALGGVNSIEFISSDRDTAESEANLYQHFESDLINQNNLGLIGLTHKYIYNEKLFSKLILAGSSTYNGTEIDSIGYFDRKLTPWYRGNYRTYTFQANAFVNKKLNARNSLRVGADNELRMFNYQDSVYSATYDKFRILTDYKGSMIITQPYVSWQHRFTDQLTMNTGVHSQLISVNNYVSVEPRLGFKWKMTDKDQFSLAFGVHSQAAPASVYMSMVEVGEDEYTEPNTELEFTYNYHYVFGYDRDLSSTMRIKTELYFQQISNAIVDVNENSYSMLNAGAFTYTMPDSLTNGGTGYNYGVEFTFEKFLDRGFYFLNTVSLYESKYAGSDRVEHNTAFNGQYVVNSLIGKEFGIFNNESAKMRKAISFDSKLNWAGGKRYSPIDYEATYQAQEVKYDQTKAYEEQLSDYIRLDFRVGFKLMGKRATQEWGLDLQNVLNRANEIGMRYNSVNGTVEKQYQLAFMPMMLYRINF